LGGALTAVFFARRDVLTQVKNDRAQYKFDTIIHKPVTGCIDDLELIQQSVRRWQRSPDAVGRDELHDKVISLARKLNRVCNDVASCLGSTTSAWLEIDTDELLEASSGLDTASPIITSRALEGVSRRLADKLTALLRTVPH
jgi:sirohydrochlorin ferrochelatase